MKHDWQRCFVPVILAFSGWACGGVSSSSGVTGTTGAPATGTSSGSSSGSATSFTRGSTGASGGSGNGASSGGTTTGTSSGGSCPDTETDPSNCGSCGHVCPAPDAGLIACVAGSCGAQIILASSPGLMDFAVDGTGVYWRDQGTAANQYTDGAVLKVPLGGGAPTTLASGLSLAEDNPSPSNCPVNNDNEFDTSCPSLPIQNPEIAVDRGVVYFATIADGGENGLLWGLMEVPADGGAASLVAASQSYWPSRDYSALDSFTVNGAGLYIATEIPQDYGTSVDGQLLDAGVLFGEFLSPENGAGLVSSVLLASNASDLVGAFCIGPYSGEPPLAELAVTSADAGEAVLLKGWDSPCPTSMALDANNAYLTFGNGVPVMEVSLEDGGVTALAASPNAHGIAVDDAHVYWTDLDAGAVMRVEVDGGATAVVASGLSFPTEIVVDQTSVYVQDLAGVRKVTPK